MWMNNATVLDPEPSQEDRVAALAAQLSDGDLKAVRVQFASLGAAGPALLWQPAAEDIAPAQLRFLLTHWNRLRGAERFARADRIDPLEMRPALGYINMLDPVDEGRDFRFRLFGSAIAAAAEFDLTGELMSEGKIAPFLMEYELALHRAVFKRGEPALTSLTPPASLSQATWHKLVLPLADESGAIVRMLTGVVPVTHRADS